MSPFISVRFLQAQTDARLVLLAAQGHERAFEALVRRYRRPLLAYSRRLLGSSSRGEDAVQQALLQAWIALQSGIEVRDAKSWFYRIVHNAALNMQRGSAAQDHAQLSEVAHATVPDVESWIAIRELFAELAALPPLQRQALLRTSLEGESHDEVASALGLSTGSVRGLIYRARASVRAALTALIPTPLLNWALGAGKPPAGAGDRIAELVAGGGVLTGVAVNSGVAVVTVGAVVAGVAIAPRHHSQPARSAHVRTAQSSAATLNHTLDVQLVANSGTGSRGDAGSGSSTSGRLSSAGSGGSSHKASSTLLASRGRASSSRKSVHGSDGGGDHSRTGSGSDGGGDSSRASHGESGGKGSGSSGHDGGSGSDGGKPSGSSGSGSDGGGSGGDGAAGSGGGLLTATAPSVLAAPSTSSSTSSGDSSSHGVSCTDGC